MEGSSYEERYASFEGPSVEQEEKARRARHDTLIRAHSGKVMVSGGNLPFGTPRKGKNTKFSVGGVRVS